MRWIQATLTFNALHFNPARRGKLGVWRVHHCSEVGNPLKIRVDADMLTGEVRDGKHVRLGQPVLRMMVARDLQRGAIVNPLKLALEFNDLARAERDSIRAIETGRDLLYFGKAAHG